MCSQGTWVELQRGEKGKAINSGTGHLQGTVYLTGYLTNPHLSQGGSECWL